MTSTEPHTSFHYRLPRFASHFPVQLVSPALTVDGICLNLSETGLLAHFEHPVAAETVQSVRLVAPPWTVDIAVDITHLDGCLAGMQFAFHAEQQRQFVRAVLRRAQH